MKPFTFQTCPNIVFEAGASARIAEIVAGFDASCVMLVTDRGVREAGLTRTTEDALLAAGVALTVFQDVLPDPPSAVIEGAAEQARLQGAELVLAIGGGSALDTAKLVAYLASSGDRLDDI